MLTPDYTFDKRRLAALAEFGILDTPAEPAFDGIAELAAQLCETPVALVSLVVDDRQWFKAKVGISASETDLRSSVCAHALVEPDLLVIPDLTADARTLDNPLVTGEPFIRFYAGAPLRTQAGESIGSLCVLDHVCRPQGLSAAQAKGLRSLANLVMDQLELRRGLADRDALLADRYGAEVRRAALLRLGDRLRDIGSIGEMTKVASAIVGETLKADRAGFGRLDGTSEFLDVEPDWTAEGMASIAGRHRFEDFGNLRRELLRGEPLIIEDVQTDPRTAGNPAPLLSIGIRAMVNMPVRERNRTVAVFLVHSRTVQTWTPENLAFLRNVADRVEVGVARIKAEQEQHVLNQEISHRLKNSMSMIQAIATQTLKGVPDQGPVLAFQRRLHALSTAHDVLLQQHWSAARIGTVVDSVVETFGQPDRIATSGPDLLLGARSTLSLSLLLHELTTNAVKYGALSTEAGTVTVTWRLEGDDRDAEFVLDWVEAGGPPVQPPTRTGFGGRLIRMGLVGTGGANIRYNAVGFVAEFRAVLSHLQSS